MKRSSLGSYIRALRKENELTQAQLAYRIGVTDKAVSKWERDLSYPDVALFPALADILGVTVSDLLQECTDGGQPSRLLKIFEMSHDIRTPLNIILGCADLAERHREEPEKMSRYLQSIRVSGEYLLKTIDYLMQVTYKDPDKIKEQKYRPGAEELVEFLNERTGSEKISLDGYDFSGSRILVAEDIRMNQEIIGEILREAGAEVEFADDGSSCVKMITDSPAGYYDLVLMDILMPEMDGLEATRRIRKLPDPEKAAVPVIAVSANVYEKDRRAAFEAGMDAFAEKPILIGRLFDTIKSCLIRGKEQEIS